MNYFNVKQKLPISTGDIIAKLIKKNNLGPLPYLDDPKMDKLVNNVKNPEETLKIIKNLPFEKIFDIVEEVAQGKIEVKNLASAIKERLNLSGQLPKILAEDLKKEIFDLVKQEIKPKKKLSTELSKEISPLMEKQPISSKRDVYRESVE